MIIHLRIGIAPGLKRPTRGSGAGHLFRPPIWSCSGWGLPGYPGYPGYRWALTPPFHPYYAYGVAVSFLWHFPSRHRDWALPSILPCGARTFLPLDSASDHLIHFHSGLLKVKGDLWHEEHKLQWLFLSPVTCHFF